MVSKKGFIEEDSSIISVMIAEEKKWFKPRRICFKSDYLPTRHHLGKLFERIEKIL